MIIQLKIIKDNLPVRGWWYVCVQVSGGGVFGTLVVNFILICVCVCVHSVVSFESGLSFNSSFCWVCWCFCVLGFVWLSMVALSFRGSVFLG